MVYGDRIQDVTTSSGTGAATLSGTPAATFRALTTSNLINGAVGSLFEYTMLNATDYEIGIGTLTSNNNYTRSVLFSSNANAAVNFPAGATFFVTLSATTAGMLRNNATAVAYSTTPAINSNTTILAVISGMSGAITSMSTNLTGTPYDGQTLEVHHKDNGTPQGIAWGNKYTDGSIALPTATLAGQRLRTYLQWDALLATPAFVCVGRSY